LTPTCRKVRIPRSSKSRSSLTYAVLVHRVYPNRLYGDAFEGPVLPPGRLIEQSALWPGPDFPKEPLLLEYAGSDRSGLGHRRSNHTYLLWRYDVARSEWIEIARASAVSLERVEILKSAATQHLAIVKPTLKTSAEAVSRVLCALESELEVLQDGERRGLMGLLYEQFTARLVRDRAPERNDQCQNLTP
jgi:hypothetical protein